jgi:protein-tyrosine-phosphatase
MPNDNVLTPERRFHFANRMIHIDSLEDRIALVRTIERALLAAHPGQPEPRASAGVIAAALAVIEADRAQTLTNEHVDALDIAIKIQRGMFKLPEPRAEVTDTARLDWLRDETCDLRCIDIPTGAGDSEVRWVVVQHHMSKPNEREIGRSVTEEPREAIDAARAGEKQ